MLCALSEATGSAKAGPDWLTPNLSMLHRKNGHGVCKVTDSLDPKRMP